MRICYNPLSSKNKRVSTWWVGVLGIYFFRDRLSFWSGISNFRGGVFGMGRFVSNFRFFSPRGREFFWGCFLGGSVFERGVFGRGGFVLNFRGFFLRGGIIFLVLFDEGKFSLRRVSAFVGGKAGLSDLINFWGRLW